MRHIADNDLAIQRLGFYAEQLTRFLKFILADKLSCEAFWNSIPKVYSCCNDNFTYDQPFASAAYAFCHFLDRYWRTWTVLEKLTEGLILPMGDEGVRALDIGTGPGPTPHAITDYYTVVRCFGSMKSVRELAVQNSRLDVIEQSLENNRFRWAFSDFVLERSEEIHGPPQFKSELFGGFPPFLSTRSDFSALNLDYERESLFYDLMDEGYEATEEGENWHRLPSEANEKAQRHGRYRMIVMSNFLTLESTVEHFSSALRGLFSGLTTGSAVLVIGAKGTAYESVYNKLTEIASEAGLTPSVEGSRTFSKEKNARAEEIIKAMQNDVYNHMTSLVSPSKLPEEIGDFKVPDYWNRSPNSKKRSDFRMTVYRKGRWPRRQNRPLPL